MNTEQRTVIGRVERPSDKVEDMKKCLKSVGSRKPKIEKSNFVRRGRSVRLFVMMLEPVASAT